jgi:hypothetical protein
MTKKGTVYNGIFYLDGETWLVENPNIPLTESLRQSLASQRDYIERLIVRADKMEKFLKDESI